MAVSLKDCRIGTILVENPEKVSEGNHPRIGHVIGLGMSVVGEVMPIMEWARRFNHQTTTIDPKDFRVVYSARAIVLVLLPAKQDGRSLAHGTSVRPLIQSLLTDVSPNGWIEKTRRLPVLLWT